MRLLFTLLVFFLSFSLTQAETNQLTQAQIEAGWISLFDGETLFGWQQVGEANWQVEGGELRADEGSTGWLMTTGKFADYELHVEFKASPETNSGVFLRSANPPTDSMQDCVEVNIAPQDNPFPTPSLVGRLKIDLNHGGKQMQPSGAGYRNVTGNQLNAWDGKWHSLDILVKARHCEMSFDKVTPQVFFSEESNYGTSQGSYPARGHIGLQFNGGPIAFRNVRLKPLGMQPIFNGKDLSGWNTERAEVSRFEVTDAGELQVFDGRGQLESDKSYGDFVLQLECFVNGDALNSGVFFRCIPGDFMMGYECQIHNGMHEGDPTKPQDCGTGGFFRRQNARRIVARDREWFALTLLADGPQMAAWVNGYQVSDWTDTRKPDANPRRGLRLQPGTLAIQGHDPTTDLRFRKLGIAEMEPQQD